MKPGAMIRARVSFHPSRFAGEDAQAEAGKGAAVQDGRRFGQAWALAPFRLSATFSPEGEKGKGRGERLRNEERPPSPSASREGVGERARPVVVREKSREKHDATRTGSTKPLSHLRERGWGEGAVTSAQFLRVRQPEAEQGSWQPLRAWPLTASLSPAPLPQHRYLHTPSRHSRNPAGRGENMIGGMTFPSPARRGRGRQAALQAESVFLPVFRG